MDAVIPEAQEELYLVFLLDENRYGVSVSGVREIIPMIEITPVPNTRSIIKGVINLRGSIIPIIDIRRQLGLPDRPPGWRSCIIVADSNERPFGFIADRVTDCLEIDTVSPPEEATPDLAANRKFLHGIGEHSGQIIILLALKNFLTADDHKALKSL